MAMVIIAPADADKWADGIRGVDSTIDVRVYPDLGNPDDIIFAAVWKPPHGALAKCKNLKAISALGAGVDSILSDPQVPKNIPIVRIVEEFLAERMATYVTCAVLNLQRRTEEYMQLQQNREWKPTLQMKDVHEVRVGIMGFGAMGQAVATMLKGIGYPVSAWTRSPPQDQMNGVNYFSGKEDGLDQFLSNLNVVVCLVPLTAETRHIINKDFLAKLPKGASVINVARGGCLNADDLVEALDSGHIERATLDVFEPEPLPKDSPLWAHPKIRITPHNSASTNIRTSAPQLVENRRRAAAGEELLNLVDISRGY
eukprot:jgi/Chlat1/4094/Chrsp26S04131